MKFSIKDRLHLLQVMPKEGNLTTVKVLRQVQEELEFSEDELDTYEIETDSRGGVSWNEEGKKFEKEVEISDRVKKLIRKSLKELDKKGKLYINLIDLYEMFIPEKKPKLVEKESKEASG